MQVRHEEMAAFEAVGYAKFGGRDGVCLATSGPGPVHLLNGLYDAKLDHVPVVAIVGQTARSAMGGSYQQEIDLQALYKNVAVEYLVEVNVAEQLPSALDRAFRTAVSGRCPPRSSSPPTCRKSRTHRRSTRSSRCPPGPPSTSWPRPVPPDTDLEAAAEVTSPDPRLAKALVDTISDAFR